MKEPIAPSEEDCCNSGCNPCIFDIYQQQLKIYKNYLETGSTSTTNDIENALSQLDYRTFILRKNIKICESHIFLGFKMIEEKESRKVWWKLGDHLLLKYNSDTRSCTRAYTPLKLKEIDIDCDFHIIVKVYENGLVSNFLNKLQVGEKTLWRGPYGSYEFIPNKFNRVVMIAQGTGIAPFVSIIEKIIDNEEDMTRIVLYYCVKNSKSILLREELYKYREFWNFTYKIFLGNSNVDGSESKYEEPLIHHKLGLEDLSALAPLSPKMDQFLLCGSAEFMQNIKTLLSTENGVLDVVLF